MSTTVVLERDGHDQPWGFRLQGGTDVGLPLSVQRVLVGTPAQGVLKPGDLVTKIGSTSTSGLTHQQACDLFSCPVNQLNVDIKRVGSGGSSSGTSSSSVPTVNAASLQATLRQQQQSPQVAALPRTTFVPKAEAASLAATLSATSDEDKLSVTNQPYRTLPLVQPSVRVLNEIGVGSYSHLKLQEDICSAAREPQLVPISPAQVNAIKAKDLLMKKKVAGTLQNFSNNFNTLPKLYRTVYVKQPRTVNRIKTNYYYQPPAKLIHEYYQPATVISNAVNTHQQLQHSSSVISNAVTNHQPQSPSVISDAVKIAPTTPINIVDKFAPSPYGLSKSKSTGSVVKLINIGPSSGTIANALNIAPSTPVNLVVKNPFPKIVTFKTTQTQQGLVNAASDHHQKTTVTKTTTTTGPIPGPTPLKLPSSPTPASPQPVKSYNTQAAGLYANQSSGYLKKAPAVGGGGSGMINPINRPHKHLPFVGLAKKYDPEQSATWQAIHEQENCQLVTEHGPTQAKLYSI